MPRFLLALERSEISRRRAVEVHPGDRLSIVVVEQYCAVRLCIAHHDPLGINGFRPDRADNIEPVNFLLGGDDVTLVAGVILYLGGARRVRSAECGRKAIIHAVPYRRGDGIGDDELKLLANRWRQPPLVDLRSYNSDELLTWL